MKQREELRGMIEELTYEELLSMEAVILVRKREIFVPQFEVGEMAILNFPDKHAFKAHNGKQVQVMQLQPGEGVYVLIGKSRTLVQQKHLRKVEGD